MTDYAVKVAAETIRDVQRLLVRELGMLSDTFSGTKYSARACHAIWEIGKSGPVNLKHLSELLVLDETSLQQTVTALLNAGEIYQSQSDEQPDKTNLILSAQGQQTLSTIDSTAQGSTVGVLSNLTSHETQSVLSGLQLYTNSLGAQRKDNQNFKPVSAEIRSGWQPGLVGRAVEMHATYYSQTVDFGAFFEATVASGLGDLVSRFGTKRNNAWSAIIDGKIVGTVFIDGEDLGMNRAHLRAFIVDGNVRGGGIGRKLLTQAMDFVDAQEFDETHLWTFKGLDAARRAYESFGFILEEEFIGTQWGKEMTEQRFVRKRGAGSSVSLSGKPVNT